MNFNNFFPDFKSRRRQEGQGDTEGDDGRSVGRDDSAGPAPERDAVVSHQNVDAGKNV